MIRNITRAAVAAALSIAIAAPGTVQAQTQDIVATAVAAGQFTTLAKALTAAGLVETLQGTGPFTVFAPTDAAFAKLPAGALEGLLADKAKLRQVLLYHVVPGKLMAADVLAAKKVTTVAGPAAQVMQHGGAAMIDKATIVKTDIAASNGVIHVIDSVMLPPTTQPTMTPAARRP
jgi:uncharacterized surface protein with fasciclin (FAS1) repeats